MGVYIPKMEMPSKKNGAVIILYPNGTAVFEDGKEYQVVEVKPHGRLIDADALTEVFSECHDDWVKHQVEIAPTIIEAEGET